MSNSVAVFHGAFGRVCLFDMDRPECGPTAIATPWSHVPLFHVRGSEQPGEIRWSGRTPLSDFRGPGRWR